MTTIRVAFYTRVSGEQQAAAHTIESQIAALSERANNDGTPCQSNDSLSMMGISRIIQNLLREMPPRSGWMR